MYHSTSSGDVGDVKLERIACGNWVRREFGVRPYAREENRILNDESQAGLRPSELPGAAALFCLYPYIGHTVVQPGTAGGVWGGCAGAARTCADGPPTRKSVGGSGSLGVGAGRAGLSCPGLPLRLCRDLLRTGGLLNSFQLSWSLPARCAGAAQLCAVRARELSPEAGRLWGAPVRCRVRTGTCSLWAPLGGRSSEDDVWPSVCFLTL